MGWNLVGDRDSDNELSGSDAAEEMDEVDLIEDSESEVDLVDEAPAPKRKRAAQGTLPVRSVHTHFLNATALPIHQIGQMLPATTCLSLSLASHLYSCNDFDFKRNQNLQNLSAIAS